MKSRAALRCYPNPQDEVFLEANQAYIQPKGQFSWPGAKYIPLILLLIVALFFPISPANGYEAQAGVVLKNLGGKVLLNRGNLEGCQPGQRWFIYRQGQPLGEIEIESTSDYESIAVIIESSKGKIPLRPGDIATRHKLPPALLRSTTTPNGSGFPSSPTNSRPEGSSHHRPSLPDIKSLSRAKAKYREILQAHSRTERFRTKAKGRSFSAIAPGIDIWNAYQAYDLIATSFDPKGNFVGDPGLLLYSIITPAISQSIIQNAYDKIDNEVEIEITYWDDALTDAYADYIAAKEGRGDPRRMLQIKKNIFVQIGTDNNEVFEIKLRNTGKTTFSLAPFAWHVYLQEGTAKIKPMRSDPILDRNLKPEEEVIGHLYFPKQPSRGKRYLVLKNIFGNDHKFVFNSP